MAGKLCGKYRFQDQGVSSSDSPSFHGLTVGDASSGAAARIKLQNSEGYFKFNTNAGVTTFDTDAHIWRSEDGATEYARLDNTGYLGVGENDPVTLLELTSADPYLTLHNNSSEDANGGRESRIIARGQQSGDEETILGYLEFAHDGSSDDQKGLFRILLNDGDDGTTPSITPLSIGSDGAITLSDGGNIVLNTTTGSQIGTAAAQKLGFWGTTPVVQQSHIADATGDDATEVNAILTALENVGILASS